MTITLHPGSKLLMPARVPSQLLVNDVDDAVSRGDREALERILATATRAGDRAIVRTFAQRYLASSATTAVGASRERLVVAYVLASIPVQLVVVADFVDWANAIDNELALLGLDLRLFGFRATSLDHPFAKASNRLSRIADAASRAGMGSAFNASELVRDLSFGHAVNEAEGLARTIHSVGFSDNATVALAATVRRLHRNPTWAVELSTTALASGTNPAALNNRAASFGDLRRYAAALDDALLSLAIAPNEFAGATTRRALRNVGRRDLIPFANDIQRAIEEGVLPTAQTSARQFVTDRAVRILSGSGRRDLIEVHLGVAAPPVIAGARLRTWADSQPLGGSAA